MRRRPPRSTRTDTPVPYTTRFRAERLKAWAGRHGRWLTLSPRDVDRADEWFDRHGGKAVLFGRMIPAVRTLISVPAGIAGMPTVPFLIYSTVGTLVWTGALAGLDRKSTRLNSSH